VIESAVEDTRHGFRGGDLEDEEKLLNFSLSLSLSISLSLSLSLLSSSLSLPFSFSLSWSCEGMVGDPILLTSADLCVLYASMLRDGEREGDRQRGDDDDDWYSPRDERDTL
jgi:hypothetical protein